MTESTRDGKNSDIIFAAIGISRTYAVALDGKQPATVQPRYAIAHADRRSISRAINWKSERASERARYFNDDGNRGEPINDYRAWRKKRCPNASASLRKVRKTSSPFVDKSLRGKKAAVNNRVINYWQAYHIRVERGKEGILWSASMGSCRSLLPRVVDRGGSPSDLIACVDAHRVSLSK